MTRININRIPLILVALTAVIAVVLTSGTTFSKYIFSENIGSFTLNILPQIDPAEAIMNVVPAGGTLTRIVYEKWNDGYTDTGVTPAVTIESSEWEATGYEIYDPEQPNIRMFAKQHDGVNYTVYVLSENDIYAPANSSSMFSGTKYGGALANTVTEIVLHNFHFPDNVEKIANMFNGCTKLTKLDLSYMDFSKIKTKADITTSSANNDDRGNFFNGTSIIELNISHTKWSGHMGTFFYRYTSGNQRLSTVTKIDMTGIDTENVTFMHTMFRGMSALTSIEGLQDLDISNVTNVQELFYNCQKLDSSCFVDFAEALKTADKLYNFKWMFYQCYGLDKTAFDAIIGALAARSSNAAKITSLQGTFHNCTGISGEVDLSALDLTSATNISEMFYRCKNINSVKFPATTNKLTTIYRLFYDCNSLTSVDLSQINTSNVTNMNGMFYECLELTEIDLSGFDTSGVTTLSKDPTKSQYFGMFQTCSKLKTVYVGEGWDVSHISSTDSQKMFSGCTNLIGGMGTVYDAAHTDKEYARIDGGPTSETPGYFTDINAPKVSNQIQLLSTKAEFDNYYAPILADFKEKFDDPESTDDVYDRMVEDLESLNINENGFDSYGWFALDLLYNTYLRYFEDASYSVEKLPSPAGAYIKNFAGNFKKAVFIKQSDFVRHGNEMFYEMPLDDYGSGGVQVYGGDDGLFGGGDADSDEIATVYFILDDRFNKMIAPQDMRNLFKGFSNLTEVHFNGLLDVSEVTDFSGMFADCAKLTTIYENEDEVWNTTAVGEGMFLGCTSLMGGSGTRYSAEHTGIDYARIDGGTENPGYFTATPVS